MTSTPKGALFTAFLVVLIDLIGFGIVLPLLPFFASEFQATPVVIGLLFTLYSGMQLVFSPLWGAWSDRVGRRPIMMLSTLGNAFAYVLFAFSRSLSVLFLSRLIAGVMAGNIAAVQAYVTDVTSRTERTRAMGLIGAAFGLGFLLGPALAGILVHPAVRETLRGWTFMGWGAVMADKPFMLPGFFAAGLSLVSFLLVVGVLPESVRRHKKAENSPMKFRSIFLPSFWHALNASETGRRLLIFFIAVLALTFGQSTLYGAFPLFCKEHLDASAQDVGFFFMYMGLIAVLVQGGLIRPLSRRFEDKSLFTVGTSLMLIGIALIPFAPSRAWLMVFLTVMSLGGSLNMPAIQSIISKHAESDRVGQVMGQSQAFAGLGRVVGPTWGGGFYGWDIRLPFVLTAAVLWAMLQAVGKSLQKTN